MRISGIRFPDEASSNVDETLDYFISDLYLNISKETQLTQIFRSLELNSEF